MGCFARMVGLWWLMEMLLQIVDEDDMDVAVVAEQDETLASSCRLLNSGNRPIKWRFLIELLR